MTVDGADLEDDLAHCAGLMRDIGVPFLAAGARTRFAMEPPGFALHDWAPGRGLVTHVVPVEDGGGAFDFELDPAYPGKGSERT